MIEGIYEQLITKLVASKIESLETNQFYIKESKIDKEEAAQILSKHLNSTISYALSLIKGEHAIENQIKIANKIIRILKDEIDNNQIEGDLVEAEGRILKAIFEKTDAHFSNLELHLKEITPYTRLTHSELFTGGNVGLSLDSELKKEILSADRVDLLVSFIKWKAIVILREAFKEFTARGGKLRVITTTYMGATDAKAIDELSKIPNTEIKISYNNSNERLHDKAYLFYRKPGFHTGYIGSYNFSRSALTDGLEWHVKITTKEIPHIIDKFQKTFESYWNDPEFELYDSSKFEDLGKALLQSKIGKSTQEIVNFFEIGRAHV